jgi:hypothetical protein
LQDGPLHLVFKIELINMALKSLYERHEEKNSTSVDMLMDHLELDRELTKTKGKKYFIFCKAMYRGSSHLGPSFTAVLLLPTYLKNKRNNPVLLKILLFIKINLFKYVFITSHCVNTLTSTEC